MEAEDARLAGYKVIGITPWEDASGGKAVICGDLAPMPNRPGMPNAPAGASPAAAQVPHPACSAEWTYAGEPGRFNLAAQYFDLQGGTAHFALSVNGLPTASWAADATLPSRRPNGDNSTRQTIPNIELNPGDVIRIDGTPDGGDPAALDYIEVLLDYSGPVRPHP
jgi:alpha-glucuronidase